MTCMELVTHTGGWMLSLLPHHTPYTPPQRDLVICKQVRFMCQSYGGQLFVTIDY